MNHPGVTEHYLRGENGSLLTDRLSGGQLMLHLLPGGGSELRLEDSTVLLHDGSQPQTLASSSRRAIRAEIEASSLRPVRKKSLRAMIERSELLASQHAQSRSEH